LSKKNKMFFLYKLLKPKKQEGKMNHSELKNRRGSVTVRSLPMGR